MGKIIVVANQKGGVGKTTTSINLAASLVHFNKRVLLVDFDPQGSASVGLNRRVVDQEVDIYRALIGQKSMKDVILETEIKNLFIAPTGNNLAGAEIELVSVFSRENRLKDLLRPIMNEYDYILIDCPPSLGLLTINALNAAHSVLIPLQCEYYAMEGLSQLLKTIDSVKVGLNQGLCIEGILLTMFDKRNRLSIQVVQEIRTHFEEAVFETIVPRNVRLSESPSHGKAVIYYDQHSTGAKAYLALAQEFIEREDAIVSSAEQQIEEELEGPFMEPQQSPSNNPHISI